VVSISVLDSSSRQDEKEKREKMKAGAGFLRGQHLREKKKKKKKKREWVAPADPAHEGVIRKTRR